MAVAEDASTPAVVRSTTGSTSTTMTTASFSPPAGSLIVAIWNAGYSSAWSTAPTVTMSSSAGSFTWTQQDWQADSTNKFAAGGIWTAPVVSAPGSITVTATRATATGAAGMQLAVRVITGASTTIGTTVSVVHLSSNSVQASITPQSVGSQIYIAAEFDNPSGTFTALGTTTSLDNWTDTTDSITIGIGKATSLTSSLSAASYGWTSAGTASGNDTFVNAVEIQPPAGPSTLAETGTGTAALTVAAAVPLAGETGTGTDALAVTVPIALADTGSGADVLSLHAAIPLADTGSGVETVSKGTPTPLAGETGSGVDALAITAKAISLADTGSGDALLGVSTIVIAPGTASLASANDGEVVLASAVNGIAIVASSGIGTVTLTPGDDGEVIVAT